MQLTISATELLLLQEPIVILQRQSIEDVEFVFLGQDQGVVHECVETRLVVVEGGDGWDPERGGVVVAVGRSYVGVFCVVDYAGFEAVEGEEVG